MCEWVFFFTRSWWMYDDWEGCLVWSDLMFINLFIQLILYIFHKLYHHNTLFSHKLVFESQINLKFHEAKMVGRVEIGIGKTKEKSYILAPTTMLFQFHASLERLVFFFLNYKCSNVITFTIWGLLPIFYFTLTFLVLVCCRSNFSWHDYR